MTSNHYKIEFIKLDFCQVTYTIINNTSLYSQFEILIVL